MVIRILTFFAIFTDKDFRVVAKITQKVFKKIFCNAFIKPTDQNCKAPRG